MDYTHSLFLGGSITSKWWGLRFSPFITGRSGLPFNITTGTDLYSTGQYTGRPSLNEGATINNLLSSYNANPVVAAPGTTNVLPRNAGTGAGSLGVNLRVSKTWGFGSTNFEGPSGGSHAGGGGGGPRGGGGRGGGFGGPPGPRGPGDSTNHRYNLTLSFNARNILNHENLNTFNGALTSPYFFQATGISGGFGAEATSSNQRRMDVQLRFAF
jgi:hypothetical protein